MLVYTLALPALAPVPTKVKPPITQVYTRRHPLISSPPLAASTSDLVLSDDLPIAPRKGKRQCAHPISSFSSYDRLSSQSCSFIASLDSISLPNKYFEALAHLGWHSAMINEMDALTDNGTWDLICLPVGKKVIGCRWVFTVKVNPDGSATRLKACLVVKGCAQTYGVDYFDTFSPVAKMTYVRLFIVMVASYNWDLHQLDIKNVFLYVDL